MPALAAGGLNADHFKRRALVIVDREKFTEFFSGVRG
jgi:hypothetical protein